jgi:hypothetical protein
LFLNFLFGTWYKGGLFSLILHKQLKPMYDVELGSIWIWKYIKSCLDNWFEKHLSYFLKHNLSQLKHGIMGRSCICLLQMSMYIELCVFSFILTLYSILFDWTSCFTKIVWELVL